MVTRAEFFQRECEDVKAAQQREDAAPLDEVEPDWRSLIEAKPFPIREVTDDEAFAEWQIMRAEQEAADVDWERFADSQRDIPDYCPEDRGSWGHGIGWTVTGEDDEGRRWVKREAS